MYNKNFVLDGTTENSDFIQKLQTDPKFFFSATAELT